MQMGCKRLGRSPVRRDTRKGHLRGEDQCQETRFRPAETRGVTSRNTAVLTRGETPTATKKALNSAPSAWFLERLWNTRLAGGGTETRTGRLPTSPPEPVSTSGSITTIPIGSRREPSRSGTCDLAPD